jgi:hypothetical protein
MTGMVVSDHGNLEDLTVGTHTMNPALFAAWGPEEAGPDAVAPRGLTDITPFALRALGLRAADAGNATSVA